MFFRPARVFIGFVASAWQPSPAFCGGKARILGERGLKIVNCMFGAKLGGLEQVFVDYSEVLCARGHELQNFVAPQAKVIPPLEALGLPCWEVKNFNQYDFLAIARIRRRLRREKPDVVIAHGNRAINLVRPAAKGLAPLIAVNHSVNVRRTIGADFVIVARQVPPEEMLEGGFVEHVHALASGQSTGDRLHRQVEVGTTSLDPAHGTVDLFAAHERPP